jgi:hypothetical protein
MRRTPLRVHGYDEAARLQGQIAETGKSPTVEDPYVVIGWCALEGGGFLMADPANKLDEAYEHKCLLELQWTHTGRV